MEVEPQVYFGGGLASAVFGPANTVGNQLHDSGIDGVNPDLETAQEALAFFARGKTRLDVLTSGRELSGREPSSSPPFLPCPVSLWDACVCSFRLARSAETAGSPTRRDGIRPGFDHRFV